MAIDSAQHFFFDIWFCFLYLIFYCEFTLKKSNSTQKEENPMKFLWQYSWAYLNGAKLRYKSDIASIHSIICVLLHCTYGNLFQLVWAGKKSSQSEQNPGILLRVLTSKSRQMSDFSLNIRVSGCWVNFFLSYVFVFMCLGNLACLQQIEWVHIHEKPLRICYN